VFVLLLSTAWIFGPVQPAQVEVRAGAGYSQVTASNGSSASLDSSRTYAHLGFDVGLTSRISASLSVPFEWAQHLDQGVVYYRRAEVSDIGLALHLNPTPRWHAGVTATIPGHDGDDALRQRFPDRADQFPKIGRGESAIGAVFGYRRTYGSLLTATRAHLQTGLSSQALTTTLEALGALSIAKGWLTIGPTLQVEVATGDGGSERVRLGVFERIGDVSGWSLEVHAHGDAAADEVEQTAGISATVVWRQ